MKFFGKVLIVVGAVACGLTVLSWAMEDVNSNTDEDGLEVINALPVCDKSTVKKTSKSVLIVSTLDGKLTALDPENKGNPLWTVATGPGSMLSSTISQMELTNNAKLVRLIPSLSGGLYKFDGEVVEPVPLSAEELLRTSFKFADNTVMTGGKDSRVYGIELDSGNIRYECTMDGCFGPAGEAVSGDKNDMEDLLMVKRETQVVRAVEPRTGAEKWNFSVSTHHVTFQPGVEELCLDDDPLIGSESDLSDELKAVVPDGIICKVDKDRPDLVQWKQKFGSPIVNAWRLKNGKLVRVNLFSNSHLPRVDSSDSDKASDDPTLYIGSYNQQLYIQESDSQLKKKAQFAQRPIELAEPDFPRVTWRPYLISAGTRTPVINHGAKPSQELPMLTYDSAAAENTALTVFTQGAADYPYDSGLYLYPEEPNLDYDNIDEISNNTKAIKDNSNPNSVDDGDATIEEIPNEPNPEGPAQAIQVVFVSLWYWWQEVLLISLVTALAMNVLITRPYIMALRQNFRRRLEHMTRRRPDVLVVERRVPVPYEVQVEVPVPKTPDTAGPSGGAGSMSASSSSASGNGFSRSDSLMSQQSFVSRYMSDYEPVQCLGAGGFGVVFESKNKIDENHYAVKRVRLPKREEAKRKVMREVKCLAKLEHRNIVRYYSTWFETPPPGWQEAADEWFKNNEDAHSGTGLSALAEVTEAETSSAAHGGGRRRMSDLTTNNPLKPFDQNKSASDLKKQYGDDDSDEDSDSFIKFDASKSESDRADVKDFDDESSGGIVFEDSRSKSKSSPKPLSAATAMMGSKRVHDLVPSVSLSMATKSKFWKDSTTETTEDDRDEDGDEAQDALVWDAKNMKDNPDAVGLPAKEPSIYLYIVMQLCQKESLRSWLRNCNVQRTRLRALSMFNEICNGVEYVHSQGMIHRDLKPSNIFFANDGTIKIGDFGLVTVGSNDSEGNTLSKKMSFVMTPTNPNRVMADGLTEQVGTELYMSPEQLAKKPYNHKVDIYSLGLILFELLVPFSTQMERVNILTDLRSLRFPSHFINKPEYELVSNMLAHEPEKRPEAADILDMDFLREAMDEHEQTLEGASGDSKRNRRRKHLSSSGST